MNARFEQNQVKKSTEIGKQAEARQMAGELINIESNQV
jgi:hypothetical protein